MRLTRRYFLIVRADPREAALFVKAWIEDGSTGTKEGGIPTERVLGGLGVQVRGRVGAIASLRVPSARLEEVARLPEVRLLK